MISSEHNIQRDFFKMRTLKLTIQYDGTNFHGWQIQNDVRTVQGELESALARLLGGPHRCIASGRTDVGVHALGQVAHLKTAHPRSVEQLFSGLRGLLPDDVAVTSVMETVSGFHARYSAKGKLYRYTLNILPVQNPLLRYTTVHIRRDLDLQLMRDACRIFQGTHDFESFRAASCTARTTVRTLTQVSMESDGYLVDLNFEGNGFLHRMVRNMVGALLAVGRHELSVSDLEQILACRDRTKAPATAPAHGLTLVEVYY